MWLGALWLLPRASHAGPEHYWACFGFLATGCLVFLASALAHFLGDGFDLSPRTHLYLENLDHVGIYLFIAGTYTPFVLCAIAPPWRSFLLILIWSIAGLGIFYTAFRSHMPHVLRSRSVRTCLFVLMGWTLSLRLNEVFFSLSWERFALLAGGGLAYTIGAAIYIWERPNPIADFFGYHEIWHSLVLVGAMLHYSLILSFYWGL
ncbi:hemolysin III family protein [bacterium]|nr:hemolysin III family protein [bacterium]